MVPVVEHPLYNRVSCFWSLSFRAKGLDVPGMNLGNIKMLETPEDARQIHAACTGSNVVLVGTSFVGTDYYGYYVHICIAWICVENKASGIICFNCENFVFSCLPYF